MTGRKKLPTKKAISEKLTYLYGVKTSQAVKKNSKGIIIIIISTTMMMET